MWDNQGPTPVRGDWPLCTPNTCYAIEGNVKVRCRSGTGSGCRSSSSRTPVFDGEKVTYLGGRQTRWHVVR